MTPRLTPYAPIMVPVPPRRTAGSRLATAALAIAFGGVLGGLWATERAIGEADAARRALAASRNPTIAAMPDGTPSDNDLARLRLGAWCLGFAALGSVAVGLAHERRLSRRIADRSSELERLSGELSQVNRT